jgi:hypothetical protein
LQFNTERADPAEAGGCDTAHATTAPPSLVATTDIAEQKNSRKIAIALAFLTGIPSFAAVMCVVVMCCGVMTGRIKIWG